MTAFWSGRRVLVTGAGGFIGSHLAEELARRGANVRALVRYNALGAAGWLDESAADLRGSIEVLPGDVNDASLMMDAARGVDTVFHLAALIAIPYSYRAPESFVRTNVEGTLRVLEAARAAEVRRLVHVSTSEVYGTAQSVPITEAHPLNPQSPYAASKCGADALASAWQRSFGLPVVTVRPFNTFGPRQSARAVIPAIAVQLLSGAPELRLGSLSPTRDLNFVSNTVEGMLAAGAAPGSAVGGTYNLGSGAEISIGDLAAHLMRACGREVPIVRDPDRLRPAASEVGRLLADSSRARTELGWEPRVGLGDGIAQTVAWLRANLGRYRTGGYVV